MKVRSLALCISLAIALIAANLIYNALTSASTVLAGESGELLYVATFSAFLEDWDLSAVGQNARVVDEQLEISVDEAQTAIWSAARPRFTDFDLQVAATAHDGPLDNAFGLVFHADDHDDSDCALPAVLLCGIDELMPLAGAALKQAFGQQLRPSYTAFLISSDGFYSLWRTTNDTPRALSAWIPSPIINQGISVKNTIRVYSRGASYQFFVNDSPVQLCIADDPEAESTFAAGECIGGTMRDSFEDKTILSGKVGVIAQSTATGGGGVVVRFDDLIVHSPAESVSGDVRL